MQLTTILKISTTIIIFHKTALCCAYLKTMNTALSHYHQHRDPLQKQLSPTCVLSDLLEP